MMKSRRFFWFYVFSWAVVLVLLASMLFDINGDAAVINYGGLIRGGTQKLIKEELHGVSNNELMEYLDEILYALQTGKGDLCLKYNHNEMFQTQLTEIESIWEEIKQSIYQYRKDSTGEETLFTLSEKHFSLADNMVHYAENECSYETNYFIVLFLLSAVLCIGVFILIYKLYNRHVHQLLFVDTVTGLLNRAGFENDATKLLSQEHPNAYYCLIKFDIANFKLINTTYGYAHGDELISTISKALLDAVNDGIYKDCLVAHTYVDNFMILSKYKDPVVDQLNVFLTEAVKDFDVSALFSVVKFTYGAYIVKDNTEPIKMIESKTTLAHKAAKENETVKVTWYNQTFLARIEKENLYVSRMEHAMKNREFQLYLQPQIDLSTMKVMGAECLVRWQLSDGTYAFPDEFIPLFERNGLIFNLDLYMVERACEFQALQKQKNFPYQKLAVNISRVTLSDKHFLPIFIDTVDKYNVPHDCIEVEIVESALSHLSDQAINVLHRLQEAGFIIAMDDYGAGYSSLSALSTLPIHILKIDRQLLWGLDLEKELSLEDKTKDKLAIIINSTVKLAHAMGIEVICEGVEKAAHVEFLQSIGCEYAQGYHFAKPMQCLEYARNFLETAPPSWIA